MNYNNFREKLKHLRKSCGRFRPYGKPDLHNPPADRGMQARQQSMTADTKHLLRIGGFLCRSLHKTHPPLKPVDVFFSQKFLGKTGFLI